MIVRMAHATFTIKTEPAGPRLVLALFPARYVYCLGE